MKRPQYERLRAKGKEAYELARYCSSKARAMDEGEWIRRKFGHVSEAVETFMRSHPRLSFTPGELIEVTGGTEPNVRRILQRLVAGRIVRRVCHAHYQAVSR